MLTVNLSVPVQPTESAEKVRQAVTNIFPDAQLSEGVGALRGTASDLARLKELVAHHQIPDTARMVMLKGRDGATTTFHLGKLAAYMGKPNLGADTPGPLGEIEVTLEAPTERDLLHAIYDVGFDTTVPPRLARVPREYRDEAHNGEEP